MSTVNLKVPPKYIPSFGLTETSNFMRLSGSGKEIFVPGIGSISEMSVQKQQACSSSQLGGQSAGGSYLFELAIAQHSPWSLCPYRQSCFSAKTRFVLRQNWQLAGMKPMTSMRRWWWTRTKTAMEPELR